MAVSNEAELSPQGPPRSQNLPKSMEVARRKISVALDEYNAKATGPEVSNSAF